MQHGITAPGSYTMQSQHDVALHATIVRVTAVLFSVLRYNTAQSYVLWPSKVKHAQETLMRWGAQYIYTAYIHRYS